MNILTTFSTRIIALTFATAILLAGCNNPAGSDDDHEEHEEHSEPDRIEFLIDGESTASYTHSEENTEGHFDLQEEEEISVSVEFFDEDGDEIHSEDLDDEYSLDWEVADAEIAEINEDERWTFTIQGVNAGNTTVQFKLMHGDHPDFSTPAIDEEHALEIHVEDSNQ